MKCNFYIRSILFMMILVTGPRVFSQTTSAQKTTFYYADAAGNTRVQYLGGDADVIYFTSFGPDSMMIAKDTARNTYNSYYKRDTARHLFMRVKSWESSPANFVRVFKHALLVMWSDSSFVFYMQDKDKAHDFPANDPRLRIVKDSIVAVVDAMFDEENKENARAAVANRQKILNAFAGHWTSKRTDPTLVRDVIKWSGNTTTTVYIGSNNYYYMRNSFGIVLYESIPVVIKYHRNNKCYLQYRMLGYEALNGGNFSTDLKDYATSNLCTVWGAGGSFNMFPGTAYEIDCP